MPDDWERVNVGTPDRRLLTGVRTTAQRHEPLVTEARFDNRLNPETLHLHVDAGIRSDAGRFDVTWADSHYYRYHYTEGEEFNYLYDYHPRPDCPDKHFHEPPYADHDAVPSCIEIEQVELVTLAVLQCWRNAVESGDVSKLQQPDPP